MTRQEEFKGKFDSLLKEYGVTMDVTETTRNYYSEVEGVNFYSYMCIPQDEIDKLDRDHDIDEIYELSAKYVIDLTIPPYYKGEQND